MPNPASFTINALTANGAISRPSAQAVDTNGTVPILAPGLTDLLVVEVINTDDAALTVTVLAGDNPPSLRSGVGSLAVSLAASGGGATAQRLIGPFEGGRFLQDDGRINITFTAATGSPACDVRVYRLPKRV